MMARILEIDEIAPAFKRYLIHEPVIARRHRAGQFVMILIHDHAERIPLTIADSDAVRGTIRPARQTDSHREPGHVRVHRRWRRHRAVAAHRPRPA
jgi:hypothetical protein